MHVVTRSEGKLHRSAGLTVGNGDSLAVAQRHRHRPLRRIAQRGGVSHGGAGFGDLGRCNAQTHRGVVNGVDNRDHHRRVIDYQVHRVATRRLGNMSADFARTYIYVVVVGGGVLHRARGLSAGNGDGLTIAQRHRHVTLYRIAQRGNVSNRATRLRDLGRDHAEAHGRTFFNERKFFRQSGKRENARPAGLEARGYFPARVGMVQHHGFVAAAALGAARAGRARRRGFRHLRRVRARGDRRLQCRYVRTRCSRRRSG